MPNGKCDKPMGGRAVVGRVPGGPEGLNGGVEASRAGPQEEMERGMEG